MIIVGLQEHAPNGSSPLTTYMPGYYTEHHQVDPLPYMTKVRAANHMQGALYQGGVNTSMWLPPSIRYVVSLHPAEYKNPDPYKGYAYFDATDDIRQDPGVFVAASETAMAFLNMGDGDVLIHCMAGLNRAGATTALTLMKADHMHPEHAIATLRQLRSPGVLFNSAFEDFVRFQSTDLTPIKKRRTIKAIP